MVARGLRGVSCVVVELLSVEVLRCSFGVSGAVVADDVGLRGWTTDAAATFGRAGCCWPLLHMAELFSGWRLSSPAARLTMWCLRGADSSSSRDLLYRPSEAARGEGLDDLVATTFGSGGRTPPGLHAALPNCFCSSISPCTTCCGLSGAESSSSRFWRAGESGRGGGFFAGCSGCMCGDVGGEIVGGDARSSASSTNAASAFASATSFASIAAAAISCRSISSKACLPSATSRLASLVVVLIETLGLPPFVL